MLILALDTAMAACSAAVWRDGTVLAARREEMTRGQAEALVPMMQAMMAEAGVDFAALDRVATTVGPGSFTGLRVCLATARAVALGAGVPVVGVTTTEALAAGVPEDARHGRRILSAVDSKRADLFLQLFAEDLTPLGEPSSAEPEAVRALLAEAPTLVAGDALPLLGELPAGCAPAPGPATPDPAVIAALAAARPLPDAPPQALYIRPPDAALPANGGRLRP